MAAYGIWLGVHLFGVLSLIVLHAVHVMMAFHIRRVREPARQAKLLKTSGALVGPTHLSMFLILGSGIAMGVMAAWWRMGWFWTAIGLLLVLWTLMSFMGTRFYDKARAAVGVRPFHRRRGRPQPPADPAALAPIVSRPRAWVLVSIGLPSFLVLLWLMGSKPF